MSKFVSFLMGFHAHNGFVKWKFCKNLFAVIVEMNEIKNVIVIAVFIIVISIIVHIICVKLGPLLLRITKCLEILVKNWPHKK